MSTPGPKETVELLTETVRQRIVERLDEVQPLLKAAREQAASKYGATGKRLQAISPEAYRNIERLAKESKKLTRGLGGLLTSDPLQAVNPASGETWGSVLQDIMDKNIVGERLAQRLDAFGSFVDFTKGGKALQGVVGHHRTALSTLRELFKNKPFDVFTSISIKLLSLSLAIKSKVPQYPLSEYKIFSDSTTFSLFFFQNF